MDKTLGELIQDALTRRGWTNAELARRSGFSATYIGNLIRDYSPGTKSGKPTRLPSETVDRIADALGESRSTFRISVGLLPDETQSETEPNSRAMEAARAAELIENFLTLPPEKQTQILALIRVMQADHPELLEMMKGPVKIVKASELTESDAEEDTG